MGPIIATKPITAPLVAAAALLAGLALSAGAAADERTCKDLTCGENALCVMLEDGPRCACQFGFDRDTASRTCVPLDRPAAGPLPSADKEGMCIPGQVKRVEEVLKKKPLKKHCEKVESRTRRKGLTYAELLLIRYRQKRNIGYGLTFMLAPLFAGGAIVFGNSLYQMKHDDDDSAGEGVNIAAGIGYLIAFGGTAICTTAASALLFTGIGFIVRGRKMLERLEPLTSDDQVSASAGPRLAVAPYIDPSGSAGGSLRIDF
jgi:hypothetical protein